MHKLLLIMTTSACLLCCMICFSAEPIQALNFPMPKRFLEDSFLKIFVKMKESFAANNYLNAADECQKIIEKNPNDKDVLLYAYSVLGEIRHRDKDYKGALEACRKALYNYPKDDKSYQLLLGKVRIDMASICIEQGKYDDALAILLEHITEYPEPIDLKIADAAKTVGMIKMCFPQERDKEKLFGLLEQLLVKYKGKRLEADLLYEIASFHEAQNNYGLAVGKYRELTDAFPDNLLAERAEGHIWRHKAEAEFMRGREKPFSDIAVDASSSVPMGLLGHPLGKYLTIEGVSGEWTEKIPNTLFVYRINGERLPKGLFSMQIWIDNAAVGLLPQGTRCIFRGYETGEMRGVPREIVKEEHLKRPEEPWGFYRYFVVTSVVTPDNLKIEEPTAKSWEK